MELAALIDALARPGALVAGQTPEVVQTHISVVFLTDELAIKVKKPIQLWGFLDYGTAKARRFWCEEEVRLNRRLAEGIYLRVGDITAEGDGLTLDGDGEVVEACVVMKRVPEGATFLARLQNDTLDANDLVQAAQHLAAFQAAHRLPNDEAAGALPSRLEATMRANFEGSSHGVPDLFPETVHEGLRTRIFRRLAMEESRILARVARGLPADGHGDIRLEHVVSLENGIGIMDCCEFTTSLRHVDPLSDAAFLSMDLIVHGRPDLAEAFEQAYLDAADDHEDAPYLLPLYRAYRAHVRAMVDEQSLRGAEVPAETKAAKALGARRTLATAWTQSRAGAVPPMIVLRGPSGVGKSWVATRIAPWLRAEIIRSDVVRKELLGVEPTWRPTAEEKREVYGKAMHERTYEAVLDRARDALARGRAAILDATYLRHDTRMDAAKVASSLGAPYAVLDITCDREVVRQRLIERAARDDDASDADLAIHDEMVRTAEPLTTEEGWFSVTYVSGEPAETCILPLLEVFERGRNPARDPLGAEIQ